MSIWSRSPEWPITRLIAELVPGHISKVPGVLRTVTHIAFREYSQRDAEDAFSIGMQS